MNEQQQRKARERLGAKEGMDTDVLDGRYLAALQAESVFSSHAPTDLRLALDALDRVRALADNTTLESEVLTDQGGIIDVPVVGVAELRDALNGPASSARD